MTTKNKTMLVACNHVSFGYHRALPLVLKDFSFALEESTISAVLGANGAGKTTLLHLMIGLHKPYDGSIHINNRPIHEYTHAELSRMISLVPQREHVPFDYRVLDYILLGRTPHLGFLNMPSHKDLHIAQEALERLGLKDIQYRRVNTLSGGEHQLVLIGRSLAQSPKILLLDEPTSHLDLNNKKRVLKILRNLSTQGITILFTTHDPETASVVADNLILMKDGQVLKQGSLNEVFTATNLSKTYNTTLGVTKLQGQNIVLLNLDDEEN